jgi:NADH-quinone oxidoreductase subunit M
MLIFAALFAGFAIKVPLFPLHTWLPLAHTQAPTAGSVLLAGILLKIGTYGFLRFNITMLPEATAVFMPWILGLSVVGIIYGALVALAQTDIKRLIAYSSVSHLGFCMLGLFALNRLGVSGGIIQMLTHGLSTGGLFACVGMLYERYHTREIAAYSGMARRLPVLSAFFVLFTLASIGLPGLGGFAGEFMLLTGMFQRAFAEAPPAIAWHLQWISVLAVFGVVVGAWYMLWLVQRILFGPLHEPAVHHDAAHGAAHHAEPIFDLSFREVVALVPLLAGSLWVGLYPQFFIKHFEPVAARVSSRVTIAAAAQPGPEGATASLASESSPRLAELSQ